VHPIKVTDRGDTHTRHLTHEPRRWDEHVHLMRPLTLIITPLMKGGYQL